MIVGFVRRLSEEGNYHLAWNSPDGKIALCIGNRRKTNGLKVLLDRNPATFLQFHANGGDDVSADQRAIAAAQQLSLIFQRRLQANLDWRRQVARNKRSSGKAILRASKHTKRGRISFKRKGAIWVAVGRLLFDGMPVDGAHTYGSIFDTSRGTLRQHNATRDLLLFVNLAVQFDGRRLAGDNIHGFLGPPTGSIG